MRSVLERSLVALMLLGFACDPEEHGSGEGEGSTTADATTQGSTSGTATEDTEGAQTEGEAQDTEAGDTEASDTEASDTEGEASFIPGRACPPDSFVTADNFGMPVMLSYCNGCHSASLAEEVRQGAPVGVDFDTLDDVRIHAERIYARAADDNAGMPPVSGLSDEDRMWLGDWLACGAP